MAAIELKKDQTIVFDGDSLTSLRKGTCYDQWPWLRISNSHRSWGDVLSELLFCWRPELNLTFRTAAVGGSTCREVAARFEQMIEPVKPDWVFMTLGGNDQRRGIPLEEFEQTLRTYAERISSWGGALVFLTGLTACPNASERTVQGYSARQIYYETEERLATEVENILAIDAGTGLLEKSKQLYEQYEGHDVYSDGTHFSHLGAIIIAGEVLKGLGILNG